VQFGCYRPAVRTEPWLQRTAWMDDAGRSLVADTRGRLHGVAVKRVHGMRLPGTLLGSARPRAAAAVPLVRTAAANIH
jgi:hypothetical protein